MRIAEFTFWVCLLLIAHTYLFYPVILFLAYSVSQIRRDWRYLTSRRNRRTLSLKPRQLPRVSLIVPLYNEEACLPSKIANLRQIDYPRKKFEAIFVSDGSTDRTNEILRSLRNPGVKSCLLAERKGKWNALNVAVARAKHEILIFSDASTLFEPDSVKTLVRHFVDPRVGVVCGSLCFERTEESERTEGVYWKYENMLRLMEARLGATQTASGAIYAMRRQGYSPLAPDTIIEDLIIPLDARRAGYRVLYDPEAKAIEFAASSVAGEFTRRVRLAVGSYRVLMQWKRISLDGFRGLAFASHKILRWILPFLLIGLFVSNAFLWNRRLYAVVFAAQWLFYLWASVGFAFRHRILRVRYALMGYFLLAINVAFLVGFFRLLVGREEVTWQRVN